jgi:hypothetical protein
MSRPISRSCTASDYRDRFQIAALIPHDEPLPRPVRTDGFNRGGLRRQGSAGFWTKAKARRYRER